MNGINIAVLVGHVAYFRAGTSGGGRAYLNMTICCMDGYRDAGGTWRDHRIYVPAIAYGKLAEVYSTQLSKQDLVVIEGKFSSKRMEYLLASGKQRIINEVIVVCDRINLVKYRTYMKTNEEIIAQDPVSKRRSGYAHAEMPRSYRGAPPPEDSK